MSISCFLAIHATFQAPMRGIRRCRRAHRRAVGCSMRMAHSLLQFRAHEDRVIPPKDAERKHGPAPGAGRFHEPLPSSAQETAWPAA